MPGVPLVPKAKAKRFDFYLLELLTLSMVDTGYWYARGLEFLNLRWVNVLEWRVSPVMLSS